MARLSEYSDEIAEEICSALSCTHKSLPKLINEHPGWPGVRTVYDWLEQFPQFSHQYARARSRQREYKCDTAEDVAQETEDVQRAKVILDARKWHLKVMEPKKYGERLDLTTRDETDVTTKSRAEIKQHIASYIEAEVVKRTGK